MTVVSNLAAALIAEFIGTFLLVVAGPSVVAFSKLNPFSYSIIAIAGTFGGVVAVVNLIAGKLSGANINPAVSLAHAIMGNLTARVSMLYITLQFAACLVAGIVLSAVFPVSASAGYLGSTQLGQGIASTMGLVLEAAGTFVLVFAAIYISRKTWGVKTKAVLTGFFLFAIILTIGPLTGASLNPARSLGPAFGAAYFENFEVYLLGPFIGGAFAGTVARRLWK